MNKKEAIKLIHDLDDCRMSRYPSKKTLRDLGIKCLEYLHYGGVEQFNHYISGMQFAIKHCFNIKEGDLK